MEHSSKKLALGYWSILWSKLSATYPTMGDQLAFIKAHGYDGVALCSVGDPAFDMDISDTVIKPWLGDICGGFACPVIQTGDEAARDDLKALLNEHQLQVPMYMCLFHKPFVDSPGPVLDWLDFMNEGRYGEFTRVLNIGTEAIYDPSRLATFEDYTTYRSDYVAKLRAAADLAAGRGYSILIELEPGMMFSSRTGVVSLFTEVDRENVSLVLDLGHTYALLKYKLRVIDTEDWDIRYNHEHGVDAPDLRSAGLDEFFQACSRMPGGVKGVQVWDNVLDLAPDPLAVGGSGLHYGLGEGTIDFQRYLTALRDDARFDGDWLVVELFGSPTHDAAVENAPRILNGYLRDYAVY